MVAGGGSLLLVIAGSSHNTFAGGYWVCVFAVPILHPPQHTALQHIYLEHADLHLYAAVTTAPVAATAGLLLLVVPQLSSERLLRAHPAPEHAALAHVPH